MTLDVRTALSEAMGAQWMAIGAGLLTAPIATMRLAGMNVEGATPSAVARILGLRDLVIGAAVLSVPDARTRRRLQRAIGVMALGETVLFLLLRREQSTRVVVRLGVVTLITATHALIASFSDQETPAAGVPLLAGGYLLSVAPTLRLAPVIRERDGRAFVAFEVGCLLLSLGWLRRRQPLGPIVNSLAAAGAGALWLLGARHGPNKAA
jgi:hypothetical protein